MPVPLFAPVRGVSPENQADDTDHVGNRGEQAGHEIRMPQALDDLRQEEGDAVAGDDAGEINQRQHQHARIGERLQQGQTAGGFDVRAFGFQFLFEPFLFVGI